MLERIDPKLHRAEPLPVAPGGDRDPGRKSPQGERRGHVRSDDGAARPERVDEMLARLAAALADIERVGRGAGCPPTAAATPNASSVAAQIARDGAGALAAQAVLGATGVRLVLDRGDAGPERPRPTGAE